MRVFNIEYLESDPEALEIYVAVVSGAKFNDFDTH